MEIIDIPVTYITEKDLHKECEKWKDINRITIQDVKDIQSIVKATLVILKFKGKYKVIKSRY